MTVETENPFQFCPEGHQLWGPRTTRGKTPVPLVRDKEKTHDRVSLRDSGAPEVTVTRRKCGYEETSGRRDGTGQDLVPLVRTLMDPIGGVLIKKTQRDPVRTRNAEKREGSSRGETRERRGRIELSRSLSTQ